MTAITEPTAVATEAEHEVSMASPEATAQELLEQGLANKDTDEAVDILSKALEKIVAEKGELDASTARYYHEYGRALIESSKADQDVFAKMESQTKRAEEEKQEEKPDTVTEEAESGSQEAAAEKAAEEASPTASSADKASPESSAPAAEAPTVPSGKAEAPPEKEEEVASTDAKSSAEMIEARQLAWELLETARVIYEKQEGKQLDIASVHCLLGDVAMEDGNFTRAYQEYVKATQLFGKTAGIADRRLGSSHQLAGICALYDQQNEASIFHYTAAAEAFNNVLTELLVKQEVMEAPKEETEDIEFVDEAIIEKLKEKVGEDSPVLKEANELNGIVNNLIERVEEIQEQMEEDAKNPELQKVIATLGKKIAEQFIQGQGGESATGFDKPTSATATAAPCEGAQEINVLVPKKRPAPTEEGVTAKKPRTEAPQEDVAKN